MPSLIILQIRPADPVDGTTFTNFLSGNLTIKAFDLTFNDSTTGVLIGTATGLADPHLGSTTNNNVNINNKSILQHYLDIPDPLNPPPAKIRVLESAATAVIVINTPAGHTEYSTGDSVDIRLEISRGGMNIVTQAVHFNVNVVSVPGALSTNQKNYFAMAASAYVTLPSSNVGLGSGLAYVDLPPDGQPPKFDDLVKAIDLVLAKDPDGPNSALKDRPPLTIAQSRQVASEIVWNRVLYPPPVPRRSLGEMYTKPPVDPAISGTADDIDKDRKQFEAELAGYQATHDAEAMRLAGFVFAASAAVACEVLSKQANRAVIELSVITAASGPGEIRTASVILKQAAPLNPSFIVPAAFFYALGAMMPAEVSIQQRYDMARLQREPRVHGDMQTAIDSNVITVPASPLTVAAAPAITLDQAARRLHALGSRPASAPEVTLAPPITAIVSDWLGYAGPTDNIHPGFWVPEAAARPAGYLDLLLEVVTHSHAPLIAQVKLAPLNVANVAGLVAVTDQEWRNFFLGPPVQLGLLPPFTQPGTPRERVEAFIRHLRKFFQVPVAPGAPLAAAVAPPPTLDLSIADIFKAFTDAYLVHAGAAFSFGNAINTAAQQQATADVFPGDLQAQAWLKQAIETIDALYRLTDLGAGFSELHFSLMEALFSRGFTSVQDIQSLSLDDFQDALTGTVAYPHAAAIHQAGAASTPKPPKKFQPVNPDGSLTDCIPPPHLSPLGPVAYLVDMLRLSAASTCADPFPQGRIEIGSKLAILLSTRRGPMDMLHATSANLSTPLPMIDLVNESLESLVDGLPVATGGAIYDTAVEEVGRHKLKRPGVHDLAPFRHDPQTLFSALPEHSSPAMPVKKPGAYDKLKTDFTAPDLPYPQGLDINRSYLAVAGSTRFAAMRAFRRDITEFAIDPANEPAEFQRHLWRYPARFPIALEYLGISQDEYTLLYDQDIVTAPAPGKLLLREMFGFPSEAVDGKPWLQVVTVVPEFLQRTGLGYCAFLALWRSGFVPFVRAGADPDFPECLPCCPDKLEIAFPPPLDPLTALRKLAVFIRLWRTLQMHPGAKLSFTQLRDISDVLLLFNGDAINPGFLRELAALLMLRDFMDLPLSDANDLSPAATGAARTHLLALWKQPAPAKWNWVVDLLIHHIDAYAEKRYPKLQEHPELIKLITDNLDPLSQLAGFDPAVPTDTWHAKPTATLRFIEVLAKIYTSEFTAGQIGFLFTDQGHLAGDDPFPLTDANETIENPLDVPEDQEDYRLWALRRKLLDTRIEDEEAAQWTWQRMVQVMQDEFGYVADMPGPGLLDRIGMHFFPSVLERGGQPVALASRQYRFDLAAASTSPLMWNTPPNQPFRYDAAAQALWTALPLMDEAVIEALQEMRPLSDMEQKVVRDLYFSPRAELAQIAFIFEHFGEAVERLIHEADEAARWAYFQRAFALFYRRSHVIAQHLAEHVAHETGIPLREGNAVAWKVLRHLHADENFSITPWENDSGALPDVTWNRMPHGGAFAALLGLTGTGLLAEFSVKDKVVWREVGGALSVFSAVRNAWNAPVPVIVPALDAALTPEQQRFVVVRNGLALREANGEPLGGMQPFAVRWSGLLLIERAGAYCFQAGAPGADNTAEDKSASHGKRWRLLLRRGQKSWIMLNHGWQGEDAPDFQSGPLSLRRGAYQVTVEFEQTRPTFETIESICREHVGFEIRYTGPDSGEEWTVIPVERLYRDAKQDKLSAQLNLTGVAASYLDHYYTSTVRDMRRTYQRAFKALLFVHNFSLSVKTAAGDRQSELGYMLDHGKLFFGSSYPRTGLAAFGVHRAHFNFNLLPVTDPYQPPTPAQDGRHEPSARRQAALFDWWERIWDYTLLREETRPARERPAWLLFYEASERQPDDPPQLVRHLGVEIRHAPLVLNYFAMPAHYTLVTPDLEDERWPVRVWQARKWIQGLHKRFFSRTISDARPSLWASDDPGAAGGAPPLSGNENLTQFVRDGYVENDEPRRYEDLLRLNNKLRVGARAALLAYLCGMDRVPLPWGGHAIVPRDLSDLLLQDVEVGVCQRASRIEEAISAVHKFIQRARLGLEPGFMVTPALALLWDRDYASFQVWEICTRRRVYRENWIGWTEVEKARKTEAFRFLQGELRRATLTVPVPGGLEYWPGSRPPAHPGLTLLQSREPAGIKLLLPGPDPEGLDLLGTPERDARPSWLAPLFRMRRQTPEVDNRPPIDVDTNGGMPPASTESTTTLTSLMAVNATAVPLPIPVERIPLWIQAAIRLGTRFLRIAAAGVPPAAASLSPRQADHAGTCCVDCGKVHPLLIDEYYFWLQDTRYYASDGQIQDADIGATPPEMLSDWHRPEKLPTLLHWESEPMVHLFWCRVHNGEFKQVRRSDEGLRIEPALLAGAMPQLNFMGRTGDALRFQVSGGITPTGHLDPTPPGFRYDMATDSAVPLPLVAAPPPLPATPFPGGLHAYPYFAYFEPGAPLLPLSMFAEAIAVAGHLRAHCQFEAALKWYALVFNPLQEDSTWAQCLPPGSGEEPTPIFSSPTHDSSTLPASTHMPEPNHPPRQTADIACCPDTPVSDDTARNRAIVLDYLETLLQWTDSLLCRNTPEHVQRATVIADTIQRVLGERPLTIFASDNDAPMTLQAFMPRPAPLNPRLMSLYDRIGDRLALIHHCLNGRRLRNGRPNVDMPYFGDSPLRDGWQTTMDVCQDEMDWCLTCCSAYRFTFLLQKAIELATEVRALGAALLAAFEKGDAEYLASLRATHERQLLQLALEIRQQQWREADWQVQSLQKTKEGAQARLRYHELLILNGLNSGEIGYEALTGVSMASRAAGNISESIAQGIGMTPDMWIGVAGIAGTPLQFQQLPIGNKLASGFSTAARILNALAEIANSGGSLSLTEGGWDRREDEWRHQVEIIGIEIEQIERQILAAQRRKDMALRELNNHRRQMENAVEIQNYLRDKFTSHELYLYLQQETAALHRQVYELALQTARQAQRAFNFERGYTAHKFLPEDAWDSMNEALLAGDKLQASLRQMEKAYLNANCREYELTKHISLRLHFPHAFLRLQTTGHCEIDLPEWLFDLDYPGHYMRRIKNVSLTLPCVVGPYVGVHCRLTLLSSRTRVDPRLIVPPSCCCDDAECIDSYRPLPDDARIVKAYAATEAIATSGGQNDAGLFELNFRDERYLPFEFAGAVSRWNIELPQENNQWPLESLSDCVMHINFMAREGGDVLRRVANRNAQHHLPGNGVRLIDVRHDMPDAWQALCRTDHGRNREMPLRLVRSMFPFVTGQRRLGLNRIELFIESDAAIPSASQVVELRLGDRASACGCEYREVTCIASAEWPRLFHGVIEIEPRWVSEDSRREFGALTFRSDTLMFERIIVLCGYEIPA